MNSSDRACCDHRGIMGTGIEMEAMEKAWRHLQELRMISECPDHLTRTFGSEAMQEAGRWIAQWMTEAGLAAERDAWHNIFARSPTSDKPILVLGSHYDTVRNAGAYDGAVGILAAIAAAEILGSAAMARLPFTLEVAAFSEEEGVRFPTSYLGSRAALGRIDHSDLDYRDADGVSLRDVIPLEQHMPVSRYLEPPLSAYVEVHIEQGPVLENEGLAMAVLGSISGQSRVQLRWLGESAHAGTCPMALRRDALAGAAEWVLQVEKLAREVPDLVATVGSLEIHNAASNVVPGCVNLSLDLRHPVDEIRLHAVDRIRREAEAISVARLLHLEWTAIMNAAAVPASDSLRARLTKAVESVQGSCPVLNSGAGHDAVMFAETAEMGMILLRCEKGISHHPNEAVTREDFFLAITALHRFLLGEMQE